jgi:hypothetical protein
VSYDQSPFEKNHSLILSLLYFITPYRSTLPYKSNLFITKMSDLDPNGSKEPIPFNVSDNYAVHDIIGEGAYGVVV